MAQNKKVYRAIGLMSGTSVDGIDAALIDTDGHEHVHVIDHLSTPYDNGLRARLKSVLGSRNYDSHDDIRDIEKDMTLAHTKSVKDLIKQSGTTPDLIGFHGQTLFHDPDNAHTFQIGDGALLARETGIDVVNDFRTADVKSGGQGAPFLPLYHRALVKNAGLDLPVVILNLGGVANVTWIGEGEQDILAFDTGPASALIDDWVARHTDQSFDKDGIIAAKGTADMDRVEDWLSAPYFAKHPPKSLDRDDWPQCDVSDLSLEDGAATLTGFSAHAIARAAAYFPSPAQNWYASGGGRHNPTLMGEIEQCLRPEHLHKVDDLGWNGDFIEAEGFAYLAVRSQHGWPLSVPGSTGCPEPVTGGVFHPSKSAAA